MPVPGRGVRQKASLFMISLPGGEGGEQTQKGWLTPEAASLLSCRQAGMRSALKRSAWWHSVYL